MRRPASIMIAVGFPGGPHGDQQDEDGLDRERGDDNGGEGDQATELIESILSHLQHRKSGAVRLLRAFAAALEDMCDGFMEKDYHRVGDAADAADRKSTRLN